MGKGLHKVFKAIENEINNVLRTLWESGSEVSRFITEARNFSEVTRLPADVKKSWLKDTLKEIKKLINTHTFLMDDTEKLDPVTQCMDVFKAKI